MEKHVSTAAAVTDAELTLIDRYWRAANYLSAGQIYLLANPLLREPLKPEHIKPRLLGHWGTTPGLNFIYAHLNRLIRARDLDVIYICGPGHGGPGMVANTYLEGTYSEIYPEISEDAEGMRRLFRQFSFPGGIPSHAAPETPGSIHEGGELGYALVHAYGAAFDNPNLVVACVVGDGEAETGPLAASWHSNKFLNPARDGAVLPILHLNGYKIANPTILGRAGDDELRRLFEGYGYETFFVDGHEPRDMHQQMAATLDQVFDRIRDIQKRARNGKAAKGCPRWPMILLRSPKGWTGPKEVDGKKVEGFWRAHQVPVSNCRENAGHRKILEDWMRSYDPEDLFDADGRLKPDLRALAPVGERRMGANPHANGGLLRLELNVPDISDYAVDIGKRGSVVAQSTEILGHYLRDTMKRNAAAANFRIFGPDETESNRLGSVFDVTDRIWMEDIEPYDIHLSRDGRVMEVLSEHLCQGWLEGYLLTGRHGLFSCYEAFIHIIDSMFNQHAKWLKVTGELEWRKPISSLNYLLTSHVWRQDHNGFSHQDPGFVDLVANKKADIVRIYLPPDANTLLWVGDHCLRTYDRINVIVAGKQPEPQWLSMNEAVKHCEAGIGIWHWASNEDDAISPDLVMACAGDVPTMETLAAVDLLRKAIPALKIRTVNVVDLLALQSSDQHPHGLTDEAFDAIFTSDKPVIFAYHGYPYLIHRLTYKRTNHQNIHVRGFIEEGTTTTPFDMTVLNQLDRFHLAIEAIERVPGLKEKAKDALAAFRGKLAEHHDYVREHGEDMPEVRNWVWPTA
ncbi:phosphoketolase family protein [Rhizobium lentis]|uniref:Probable phosphoketolase n=1 Tax=Rhizobium lentis TaxID=1138194 RepID=A0ABS7II53_9HYPH|nr:phosphoketolase family protein [Rhizobium lentis]MBX4959454.1 phosphoketolase family protein [Rhizobium lentis]MBX4977511.1 phosphoketolase family protein [Rhizobium lentis]MBX4989398.1 phosphoketolase family protein [Rhizobium lentis]MBX5007931.1 phosphoketolase family protein [Rhizobium lentis]MBX5032562.1 phosphoketolase family protein [Rhizobium lentis]